MAVLPTADHFESSTWFNIKTPWWWHPLSAETCRRSLHMSHLPCINQAHNIQTTNKIHSIVYDVFQPVHHPTSPTRWIKTDHINATSISPYRLNNFKPQNFKHYPFLTYICIPYIILSEIIIIFKFLWSDDTTNHIVLLYCCNNFSLKMATITAETCW